MGRILPFIIFFLVATFLLYGVYKITGGDEFLPILRGTFEYQGPLSGSTETGAEVPASESGTSVEVNRGTTSGQPSPSYTSPSTQQPLPRPAPQPTPLQGFSVADLSPFYKKVRVSNVRAVSYYSGDPGKFSLIADYSLEGSVNVTGWKLRVNKGGEVVVPQAVEDINLTQPSQVGDIILDKGQTLRAYGTQSPFSKNVRLNKCMGYLNEIYHPTPSFPSSCPTKNRSDYINFSGRCQTFIRSLSSCETPTPQELNQYSLPNDLGCRSYLDTLNYNGCYQKYRYTANFFSKEWRVWLNQAMPFDQEHDRVLLLDQNGLIVNEYIY